MPAQPIKYFISDQETVVDLLYFEAIARTVITFVRQDPRTPITIGVHGDWGAGKSSVLRMTEAALAADKKTLSLWFNGWVFEGFEDAKTVVLETIVTELKRARPTSTKVADAAKRLFRRIQWLKLARKAGGLALTATTGIPSPEIVTGLIDKITAIVRDPVGHVSADDIKAVVEHAGDFLKAADPTEDAVPEHMHAFRKEFEELLDAADIDQLVILIDDLDRCLPETAIATLEAIRLFLFVPRTAYVIGADEGMIEYAVRRHFPDLAGTAGTGGYSRNYLEKLIQIPFRIPALGLAETRAYITLLLAQSALGEDDAQFKKLLEAAREDLRRPWQSRGLDREQVEKALAPAVPIEVQLALRISGQITRALTEGTRGNPRQIKRFLNSMAMRQAIAQERGFGVEIKLPILVKLMLAERFASDFYDQVARMVSTSADGKVRALAELEARITADEDKQQQGSRTRQKANEGDEQVAEWLKNEWIVSWSRIEPTLGEVDLRPYVFVTRDKRGYLVAPGIIDHLEGLVDRLMGQELAVRSTQGDLDKLSESDSRQVFEALRGRVTLAEKLNVEPRGMKGLVALVRTKANLQGAFLQLIKELPEDQLGAWAATSCALAFTLDVPRGEYRKLLERWKGESANAVLKSAAAMALTVK